MPPSTTAVRSVTRDIKPELLLVVNYYLSTGGDSMILIGPVPPTIGIGIHLNDSKKPKKRQQEKVYEKEEFDDIFQQCIKELADKEKDT